MAMRINDSSSMDSPMMTPQRLFGQLNQCMQSMGGNAQLGYVRFDIKSKKSNQEIQQNEEPSELVVIKRKDNVGLKKLIREQKIKNIQRKFITKLKLNNINSPPVQFYPYNQAQSNSILDKQGLQIPDWLQKLISILIVFNILSCVFVETTYIAFPQIVQLPVMFSFQILSLIVFTFELISSLFVVKLVDGKKVETIGAIMRNYFEDGMIIDLAYLIVLIVDSVGDASFFRLIIFLKLPQCFARIQKIENSLINTFYKEQYWGLTKVFLLNFSISHLLSILLILMSELDSENSWMTNHKLQDAQWSQKYVWAFYWGTTIMLTVGFGDIAPANYKEAICIVLIETFSCLCLAYNINCVGSLISNIKSQDIQKNRNIKTFKILSNRNNLTENLEMKIHNYIEESTNIKKKFNFQEESNFISTLPRELKAEFLKESNKRIFESLTFFKNLTEKTLLNFAEVIQMKICHPEQIIKKRGQVSGVTILKQGKIGLSTKLNGSIFSNTTIQTVQIKESDDPFLLSLDFLSNDRAIYEMKSEEYSILYYLDRDKTLDVLKTSELDYEHFCFLRDKSRNLETDFEVFHCIQCNMYHSRFECPKLHYCPLKKHSIDKYLHILKTSKSPRRQINRQKKVFNAFVQLSNNEKFFDLNGTVTHTTKYASYKIKGNPSIFTVQESQLQENLKTLENLLTQKRILTSYNTTSTAKQQVLNTNSMMKELPSNHRIQYQLVAEYLKDQLEKLISNRSEVWLLQCDEIKDFKFYFVNYNAGTLQYLNHKKKNQNIFG